MAKQKFRVSSNPELEVRQSMGGLVVRGSSSPEISVSNDGRLDAWETKDGLSISSVRNLKAYTPFGSSLVAGQVSGKVSVEEIGTVQIDQAMGSAKFSKIKNTVSIGGVSGDVEIKESGAVMAQAIQGDCSLRKVFGEVRIGTVGDDFSARECSGKVEISEVRGDAYVNKMMGVVKLDSVRGDAILQGPLPAEKHHIIANGDVIIYWPSNRNVQFLISHRGRLVNDMRLPNETKVPGEFQATIGDDSCRIIIESQGIVYLRPDRDEKGKSKKKKKKKDDFDLDLEDLLDPEELLEKIGDGLESMFMLQKNKKKKGKGLLNKIFGKTIQAIDEWAAEDEPFPQQQEKQPTKEQTVSAEEERRIVLKMLENGSISVDEASERLKRLG
ncbi:MAG: hypothetical protein AAF902_02440 [Chloroflexota bacterium]